MLADRFPHHSRIGSILRWPLRFLPTQDSCTILSGPASGLSWLPASGPHGIWLGFYERRTLRAFASVVSRDVVVWDVGAHVGLYTLVAARLGARVFAFEPLQRNVDRFKMHLQLNHLHHRVVLHQCGLGSRSGHARFQADSTGLEGHLNKWGQGRVSVFAADDLPFPSPSILKIDVEGSELDVLGGARRTIRATRPVIFVETHDPIAIDDCLKLLPGYRANELERNRYCCSPGPIVV